MKTINIHKKQEVIHLDDNKYNIDVLGGWGVKLGEFSISLKNTKTEEVIRSKKAILSIQSFAHNQRAKKILTIDVPRKASYLVTFHNPETLIVKKSNLIVSSFFTKPLANENLAIYFYK